MDDLIKKAKELMQYVRDHCGRRAVAAPWPPDVNVRFLRLPSGEEMWQLREGAVEPTVLVLFGLRREGKN